MTNRPICAAACGVLAGTIALAQSASLPQTYAFTATSNMMGPSTVTVKRNGPKELIEITATSGALRLRQLYDFQAQRVYTVDLNVNRCTMQQYVSSYAPVMHDPIGGSEEMVRETKSLRTTGRESVNGIAARLVEAPLSEGQGKYRFWLDEKFGFPVKQALVMGSGPERLLFEMRQLSYAQSPANLFVEPAGCTRIEGVTHATGGRAEMNIGVKAQGQATLGGTPAAKQPAPSGNPEVLKGKWEFTGRDGAGVQWRGTLMIEKPDPDSFDAAKYSNVCDLNMESGNAGKGAGGPCLYDDRTRTFTFAGGMDSSKFTFTAVLSPDGRSLVQGKWVEGPGSGVWSANSKR